MKPAHETDQYRLYHREALAVLDHLETDSVDAVVTDPPYSSGGAMRSDRIQSTGAKYVTSMNTGVADVSDFSGDNRDGRSYAYWSALWLAEALRCTRPGGVILLFTDWRQLPSTSDALQAGGWIWRGIVPWHKPNARPTSGRFTTACEYVLWGSAGPLPIDYTEPILPGFYRVSPPKKREHQTQKPLELMRELVKITTPGGWVLDPFLGSGTTGVAAVLEGRRIIGAESSGEVFPIAERRIRGAASEYVAHAGQLPLG